MTLGSVARAEEIVSTRDVDYYAPSSVEDDLDIPSQIVLMTIADNDESQRTTELRTISDFASFSKNAGVSSDKNSPIQIIPKDQWNVECLEISPSAENLTSELIINGHIHGAQQNIRILIDTGCQIPVVFKTGLVSPVQEAKTKLRIRTAGGSLMSGGTKGTMLSLVFPVIQTSVSAL